MNTELEATPDAAEDRVRAALAELAGYADPPRQPRVAAVDVTGRDPLLPSARVDGRVDAGRDAGRRESSGDVGAGAGTAVDHVAAALDSDPTVIIESEFRGPARRSGLGAGRRRVESAASGNPTDRTRRMLAVAAAVLLLVGGAIGIAWRQRTQSGAQVATAPSGPSPAPTTAPASDGGSAPSSSISDGTLSDNTMPSSSPATDAATDTSAASAAPNASGSVHDPNGDTAAEPGVAPNRTITKGATGEDVLALQNRLSELGFVVSPMDGVYGQQTIYSVWAFQALVLGIPPSEITDSVAPELWTAIHGPVVVAPRRPNAATARHIEIYLPQQVLVVFDGSKPLLITHVSTGELDEAGNPQQYCERIVLTVDRDGAPLDEAVPGEACGVAKTPGGVFQIHRMEPGYHEGTLGGMWEPVYFNHGIAIHGALNVPLEPASHGSVRVERSAIPAIQNLVAVGDEVAVWNGKQEPDQVSESDSLPSFDRFTPDDPNDVEGPPPGARG